MESKKINIQVAAPVLNGNERKYVIDCLNSTWISSNGKYISLFENKFAEYVGAKHAIAVSNGTVALHAALLGLDITENDEVIMPTLSYIATANAVSYCRGKSIFVDSEELTGNINIKKIEEKITKKTKAIMPVHLYGHPVDIDPLKKLAKKYRLYIIEDAAEAFGCLYKGKHVGCLGDVGIFSFFGNKNITTGEGGMIVTNNSRLAKKIRILKGQGMDPKKRYWHPIIGYNYRMTNIEAAIGLAQLENAKFHIENRQRVAKEYDKLLIGMEKFINIPVEKAYAHHGYWMYTIILKDTIKISRDKLIKKLSEKGIETRPVFYSMHSMPPYFQGKGKYPVAENISANGLNLPTHAHLKKKEQVYIIDTIIKIVKKNCNI